MERQSYGPPFLVEYEPDERDEVVVLVLSIGEEEKEVLLGELPAEKLGPGRLQTEPASFAVMSPKSPVSSKVN